MISCHIASLPERESSLRQTINSIYKQVSKIYVSLNGYPQEPNWLTEMYNTKCITLDNSLGDAAKFLNCWDEPAICLVLDDDLIVPKDYVQYMINGLAKYGGAVSLHGKKYSTRPIEHYRRNFTANFRCLNTVLEDSKVDIIGTGIMAFDNTQVKFDKSLLEHKNMADVLFAKLTVKTDNLSQA